MHAELGCGVRVPKLVGFMMGLGYNSWVHETGNIWRVAGGQRVGCLQHRERPLEQLATETAVAGAGAGAGAAPKTM